MEAKKAVRKTIEYASKFKSYINNKEIFYRLISSEEISIKEINEILKGIDRKSKRNKYFEDKYKKAVKLSKIIENDFKDILFLGVSGSVATGHPKKNDDIDFMIITKSNKLWKIRFWLRRWIHKKHIPHRQYGKKEKSDEFCFNLWLDENSLLIPKNRRNLRNSVDLVLLKPLINKNCTYEKFLLVNNWAKKWVATPYENKISNFQFPISKKNKKNNKLEKIINNLYFWPQFWYMKRKIDQETIGLHKAFFHERMVK